MEPKALAALLLAVTSDVANNPNASISRRHIVEIAARLSAPVPDQPPIPGE